MWMASCHHHPPLPRVSQGTNRCGRNPSSGKQDIGVSRSQGRREKQAMVVAQGFLCCAW